jgi:hypothetical protein
MLAHVKDNGIPIVKKIVAISSITKVYDFMFFGYSKGSYLSNDIKLRDGLISHSNSETDSPLSYLDQVDSETKILLIQALNDEIVPFSSIVEYVDKAKSLALSNIKVSYSMYGNHASTFGFYKNSEKLVYDFFSQ